MVWKSADVTADAQVIQVKHGIGDVIWHLPFIRAIAGDEPAGAITFLTLPSSQREGSAARRGRASPR